MTYDDVHNSHGMNINKQSGKSLAKTVNKNNASVDVSR